MSKHQEQLNAIGRIQDELDATLHRVSEELPQVGTDEEGRARHNDSRKAAVSRDLLRAQGLAEQMKAEIAAVYWSFKGYDDPREETA